MGYCMTQGDTRFRIPQGKFREALAAVKALSGQETIRDAGGSHFSWVDHNFARQRTLAAAMRCWRWELEIDPQWGAVDICFTGEKLGDDEVLFRAIAPFVESGSCIEMRGEDGAHWRWFFDGATCTTQNGRVVYDPDEGDDR